MHTFDFKDTAKMIAKQAIAEPEEMLRLIGLSPEQEQANEEIVRAGTALLPDYAALTKISWEPSPKRFAPNLSATAFEMVEAQAECSLLYQNKSIPPDKSLASTMLMAAGYAYEGRPPAVQDDFLNLPAQEIPGRLRVLYDETAGLLKGTEGLRVWLGQFRGGIAVSFSGTDKRNLNMVYADIVQLSDPSILYLKAAGLLALLMEAMPGRTLYVTGHSLGGGLAQFALAANMTSERLKGFAFNPAGLSMVSLRHLGADRLAAAAKSVWVFKTCRDPVSAIGGKLGCVTVLPETDRNGHGLDDLRAGMDQYLSEGA